MFNLNVPYIHQNFEFDCWYAALRMLVKFRVGPAAEPLGYEPAEIAGLQRQSLRDNIRRQVVAKGFNPGSYAVRGVLNQYPPRGLNANEFIPFAQRNGLVTPMLPPRYNPHTNTGGWTLNVLETLLRMHGPFWCAFGYGHIVVLKGVDAANDLLVHNPQGDQNEQYTIAQFNNLLSWTNPNCMMFLPPVPNANAFLGH